MLLHDDLKKILLLMLINLTENREHYVDLVKNFSGSVIYCIFVVVALTQYGTR